MFQAFAGLRFTIVTALTAIAVGIACSGSDATAQKLRFLESGNRYFDKGQYREALIEYRSAVQIDAQYGSARARLAETHERLGHSQNAFAEWVRAADTLPDDVGIQLKAGHYLLAAGQLDAALARAEAALKVEPRSVEGHILRGNALGGLNDFDKAMGEMEEAIRLDPRRGATYTQLGIAEFARGRPTEAEAAFKRAVALSPDDIDPRLALANFYIARGSLTDAEAMFASAWKLNPHHEGANRAMAASMLAMGRLAEAESYLRQLAELSSKDSAQFSLTDYYVATGRAKEAIEHLRRLEAINPGAVDVKERLARAYAASGDVRQAQQLVDALLTRDPRNGSAHLFKGQLLADAERHLEAIAHVRKAAEAAPSSAAAHFALGQLYAAQGDLAGAEKAFKEVLRLNSFASAAHTELARVQLMAGSTEASMRTAEAAALQLPDDLNVRIALVRGALASQNISRAQAEITNLLAKYPNVATVHVQHGVLAAERKQLSAARASFGRALQLDPQSLEAFAGLLMLDLQARDFLSAKARLSNRLSAEPVTLDLLLLAGRTYVAAGDWAAAVAILQRAVQMQPNQIAAYRLLAGVHLAQRNLDQARAEYDRIAEKQSHPTFPLTMAATILQVQGQEAEARKRYERALSIDPRAAVAANNLAWMFAKSGDLDKALQLAQTAATSMPDVPAIMDTLGWIYYKKNLPALAMPHLVRSVEKDPKNSLYLYHLGLVQLQAGDTKDGRGSLERALTLKSEFSDASEARRILANLDRSEN